MTSLGINIDHIATVRQARGTQFPDVVQAALQAEQGGADGITVHLREDRRHIQDADVEALQRAITTRLNLEMAATDEMIAIARRLRPRYCCLVPEKREELTTEGGLDVRGGLQRIYSAVAQLQDAGIAVSLFVDPDPAQMDACVAAGAGIIEIHTGRFADAVANAVASSELELIRQAAVYASDRGLQVNAGHGLTYANAGRVAAIPVIEELNIGHAIVARALFTGLQQAVREMRRVLDEATRA